MKHLIVIAAMSLSFNILANDATTAANLFADRGVNVANAKQAATIYTELAENSDDAVISALYFFKASEATYYVGTQASDNDDKEDIHEAGYELAQEAIDLLADDADDLDDEALETLSKSYFFYGANLGKYGEAKGIIASLSRVPELKRNMQAIYDLDMEQVEQYGANRVLGRLYYKLPGFAGGDKGKSEELLREAVKETLATGTNVSMHGLNNLYLAETLEKNKKKGEACSLLKEFSQQNGETLLPTRIPETKKEIEEAKAMAKDFDC